MCDKNISLRKAYTQMLGGASSLMVPVNGQLQNILQNLEKRLVDKDKQSCCFDQQEPSFTLPKHAWVDWNKNINNKKILLHASVSVLSLCNGISFNKKKTILISSIY